ncbi:MAG TPA: hypothetical protein DEO70_06070 [Bacteroidales bacterium]|nr:MAG: hypothetical protein A2X11_03820 [Bacteroidetes bacterium GWE2_42_24]OFY29800.1 MAG: hypothetical protein A2X09_13135 [Bacteroidetes bacterium GWF2_43_11]HBZ66388.1 hypothetical protein [Bacteroidales bacterium]
MNTVKTLLLAGLVLVLNSVMAQNAETSDKATVKKKTTATVITTKEQTKSDTGKVTAKTGTYQKTVKSQATKSKTSTTKRKPKTRKERLEMESADNAKTKSPETPLLDSFKPGTDGYIEVNHSDIQSFLNRIGGEKLKVQSFTLVYTQNGVTKRMVNNASVISNEVQNTLKGFPVGQIFSIEDVKGVTRNGREITAPVSKFRIKANGSATTQAVQKNK